MRCIPKILLWLTVTMAVLGETSIVMAREPVKILRCKALM